MEQEISTTPVSVKDVISKVKRKRKREEAEQRRSQKKKANARFYKLDSILGNKCMYYIIIGGRKTGKSYSAAKFLCTHQDDVNYWFRISERSTRAMTADNCRGLVDRDLQRKYGLELTCKNGMYVYNGDKEFCTIAPLSAFGKLKGVGFYDKDYKGWYNIILDEFQLEQGEKRTSFDILYNFMGMIENTIRTEKQKVRIFLLGNTLEEASTILKAFNFLPETFGRFYIHQKDKETGQRRLVAVLDNIEPTKEYLMDRYGSATDILGGGALSNYTNELSKDRRLITKERRHHLRGIIKFFREKESWFCYWDNGIITRYKNQPSKMENDICMRPHLNSYFNTENKQMIIDMYDVRALKFDSLITQAYFEDYMKALRTSK